MGVKSLSAVFSPPPRSGLGGEETGEGAEKNDSYFLHIAKRPARDLAANLLQTQKFA